MQSDSPTEEVAHSFDLSKIDYGVFHREFDEWQARQVAKGLMEAPEKPPKKIVNVSLVSELPTELRGTEANRDTFYPAYLPTDKSGKFPLEIVHGGEGMYRGKDIPEFAVSKQQPVHEAEEAGTSKKGVLASKPRPCTVVVRSGQQAVADESSAGWPTERWQESEHDGKDPKDMKFCITPSTQRPVVALDITLPSGRKMKHNDDDVGIRFWTGDAPETKNMLPRTGDVTAGDGKTPIDQLQLLANDNALWLTSLRLLNPSSKAKKSRAARPLIKGISEDELTQLKGNANRTPTENLVVKLLTAEAIDIYTAMPQSNAPSLMPFFNFTRTVFFAAASMGNFWWYRLADPTASITDANYELYGMPPRWLEKSWEVSYVEGGEADSGNPVTWAAYKPLLEGDAPDPGTAAVEYCLAVAREASMSNQDFSHWLTDRRVKFLATFLPNADGSRYIVSIEMVGQENSDTKGKMLVPEAGRKVHIGVTFEQQACYFTGVLIDDIHELGATLTASVTPERTDQPRIVNDAADIYDNHEVSLEMPLESVVSNRKADAINHIAQGQKRQTGPYIPAFTIGVGVSTGRDESQWLKCYFQNNPDHLAEFKAEIARHGLNHQQTDLVQACVSDGPGLVLLWGPPGTGKTKTLVALMCALVLSGIRVMFAATGNKAVDKAMEDFAKDVPEDFDDLSWCRYSGSLSQASLERDEADETEEEEPAQGNKAATGKTKHGFAHKKLQWIRRMADSAEQQDVNVKAREYLVKLLQLQEGVATGKKRKALRCKWRGLDVWLGAQYLKGTVKLVFVTNSTSCMPALQDFKLDVVLQDEAGHSTPPDAMIPYAAFKESAKFAVMAGDPNQLPPMVISRNQNEAVASIGSSILTREIKSSRCRYPVVKLKTQYRMAPALSNFVNKRIYDGELIDDKSTKADNNTRTKLKEVMNRLGDKLWLGRTMRVGIDASNSRSAFFKNSSSLYNEGEATWIVENVINTIHAGIKPEQIMIVTPYNGQRSYIIGLLLRQSKCPEAKEVLVVTIENAQAQEADVLFLSLVHNDPDHPNHITFITDERKLTVMLTRARDGIFVAGNFKDWIRRLGEKDANPFHWGEAAVFREWVRDMHKRRNIIGMEDWDRAMRGEAVVRSSFYPAPPGRRAPKAGRGGVAHGRVGRNALDWDWGRGR